MGNVWDPIDPDDVTDLFIDLSKPVEKPFLPAEEVVDSLTVTTTTEVTKVVSDFDGQVLRVRVGPADPGKWPIHYTVTLDSGQVRDFDVYVGVKDRVVRAKQ